MFKSIEAFLRIDGTMRAADIMRARAIYFTALIIVCTQLANQLSMYFMLGGFRYVHVISLVACAVVLCLGAALRWTKNFTALTLGFVGVLLLGVLSSALPLPFGRLGMADGINSSMLPLLICGTVMCAIMHSWRASMIYIVPAFAVIWGFYALSTHYAHPDLAMTESQVLMQYVRAMQASLAVVVCGVITSYFSYRMFGLFGDLEDIAQSAQRAEGLTSRYLADMSHELRTPLNGIIGLSDVLASAPLAPDHARSVSVINECGETLLAIINDVLDLSKLDAGKLDLDAEPFDPHHLCESLAALHGAAAAKKGLALELCVDASVPRGLIGDAGRLRQVLNNLLSNAVKFTASGRVDLIVRAAAGNSRASQRDLKIFVRDTGIGIPAADLATVFKRFGQVGPDSTAPASQTMSQTVLQPASQKGTGLGMAIARDLVEHMGGTVRVNSKPGLGTVFGVFITLPVAPTQTTANTGAAPQPAAQSVPQSAPKSAPKSATLRTAA